MQFQNELAVKTIGKLVAKFAIPSVISLTVTALYNIVDQIFIGNKIGYLGNGATKEALIKSRLTALHVICLYIFRHITQKILEIRQYSCKFSMQSDEKFNCASNAQDLISASLTLVRQVICQCPAIIIFAFIGGVEAALWAGPTADGIAFIIAVVFMIYEFKLINVS